MRFKKIDNRRQQKAIHDIEVAPNFFSSVLMDKDTGEYQVFEISERRNDTMALVEAYSKVRYLVGFNSKNYDDPIVKFIIDNAKVFANSDAESVNRKLYLESSSIIYNEYREKVYVDWYQIDLFLYWSNLIRKSKKISLKGLAYSICWPVIQDLPFEPTEKIPVDKFDDVIKYNINDVEVTRELATNHMAKEIDFRMKLRNRFRLSCLSSDGVKIGMDLIEQKYRKKTGMSYEAFHASPPDKDVYLEDVITDKIKFYTPVFQKVLQEIKNSINEYSRKIVVPQTFMGEQRKLIISIGVGGLHSIDEAEDFVTPNGYKFVASDVTSYYPNLLMEYGFYPTKFGKTFIDIYRNDIYIPRVNAKHAWKAGIDVEKNKLTDSSNKLSLNGLTGNLKNGYSWAKDIAANLGITLNGQLMLCMLTERLISKGFYVHSLNTDGIEVVYPIEREEEYMDICKQWEEHCRMELEHEFYIRMFRRDVNNYMAIKDNNGVKYKGMFVPRSKLPIENKKNFMVITHAVNEYVLNGTKVEDYIRGCTDVWDFLACPKVAKKYTVMWNGEEQQRINAFYASKSGHYIKKVYDEKETHLLGSSPVVILNRIPKGYFPDDIDYDFYIKEARSIIYNISTKQLTLF